MDTPDTEWTVEELMRDLRHLASPYGETLSDMQRTSQFILLVNRLDKVLTSRDTYWKERVRKEIDICEDVLKGSAGSKSEIEGAFWHLRNNLLTK